MCKLRMFTRLLGSWEYDNSLGGAHFLQSNGDGMMEIAETVFTVICPLFSQLQVNVRKRL